MARNIAVNITGESRELEQALARSQRAVIQFSDDVLARSARVGAGIFAFTQVLEGAAAASRHFLGESSQVTQGLGDASQGISSLMRLDLEGFFAAVEGPQRRAAATLEEYSKGLKDANQAGQTETTILAALASGNEELANQLRDQQAALEATVTATEAVAFAQREWNTTVIDGTAALVAFKGARDSMGLPMGPGGVAAQAAGAQTTPTPGLPSLGPLSPSQRRELALITAEAGERLPLLNDRLAQLNGQMESFNGNQQQRLQILERIARTEAEITGIYQTQAAARAAAAARARQAAEEARREAERNRLAALAREQARQLQVLEGPIPTRGNLQQQLQQIQARVAGGDDLPSKLTERFAAVAKLLREQITPRTREAIRDWLRMVRGEFAKGDDIAPVALAGLNTMAMTRGLGLSGAQARALRNRLAGVNIAGQQLAGGGQPPGLVVQSDVFLDGEKVGRANKRYADRNSIRAPRQKRGPNAGR